MFTTQYYRYWVVVHKPERGQSFFAVMWLFVLAAVLVPAAGQSCTGKSTALPADQCAAWTALYDSTNGRQVRPVHTP